MPMLTIRGWLVFSLYFTLMVFLGAHAPLWVLWTIIWGNTLLFSMLDTLNAKGRENFEALSNTGKRAQE